jgi:hypothetical protein
LEAAKILLTLEDFSDAMAQSTIVEYIEDNTPKAKAAPAPKVKAVPAASKAPAKAKAVKVAVTPEDEDAPF